MNTFTSLNDCPSTARIEDVLESSEGADSQIEREMEKVVVFKCNE